MATYKVIQDIEAEDKLVGPLTLRQFVYAGIAAVCLYICFLAYTKGFEIAIGIFFPIAAVCGFFAFPWKGEQPTEIWALAKIRFALKPRVRIWDQEGAKDIVTVTAPKSLRNDRPSRPALSQTEVRSRLKALADTIDSRGWATRNAAYGVYSSAWTKEAMAPVANSSGMAAFIPTEDMFDGQNTVSQTFDNLLAKSQEEQRQRVMQQMDQAGQGGPVGPPVPQVITLPNIPTPAAASAYTVAPLPAPMPDHNNPITFPAQRTQPQQQPPADYWFANGPAYPSNQPAAPMQPPQPYGIAPSGAMTPIATPAPMPQLAAAVPMEPPSNTSSPTALPSLPQLPGIVAVDNRIQSDMPLAVSATPTATEAAIGENIKQENQRAMSINYGHMRVLQPGGHTPEAAASNNNAAQGQPTIDPYQQASQDAGQSGVSTGDQFINGATPVGTEPVTPPPNPAILDLANNDDLDIATIARQAKREIDKAPDEVEIRLH